MSGSSGPVIAEQIAELQAIFPSDAALQDAIARLTTRGFDRHDLSIPDAAPARAANRPEAGAENPNTDDDRRQTRTLGSSIAATAGALAASGAVIATGGAALPAIAAAVAGGVGAGAVTGAAHTAANRVETDGRAEAAAKGELVLAVRLREPDKLDAAEAALTEAGATRIARVIRRAPGATDSAAWTG